MECWPEAPPWSHMFGHIVHTLWGTGHSERCRRGPWPHRHWPHLLGSLSSPSSPTPAASISRGSADLGTARQFLFPEIYVWPFSSIVCHTSDLLKQCVSYRFCSPALTSLFCSSKQTFSIYRSVCWQGEISSPGQGGCTESPAPWAQRPGMVQNL